MKRAAAYVLAGLVCIALAAALFLTGREDAPSPSRDSARRADTAGNPDATPPDAPQPGDADDADPSDDPEAEEPEDDGDSGEPDAPISDEGRQEQEEERSVDAFDGAVDKWMDSPKTASMADAEAFREAFDRVPRARKEECLQRALNLIPDENVMLLAGILFDKSQDPELLDLVYNDILNRDESVKTPVLAELFKDKSHPNWADTAWILDMTGALPEQKKEDQ